MPSAAPASPPLPAPYSVVIPAYNAAETLPRCLAALRAARPAPAEVILYDDGSTDRTAQLARAAGVRVVTGAARQAGPAVGRNRGAAAATTGIVVFVDADVVVAPDAPGLLARAVEDGAAAAFGAYAATSPVGNLAGRYANLRHHHTHVTADAEAETFWSGLGAVCRRAFERVGGFDERYARPCVEDVELGLRLRAAGGAIRIVAAARGAHLKNWTLGQLWHTDVVCRAVPWARMMLAGRAAPTLNAGGAEQIKSVLAHLVWASALLGLALPAAWAATGLLAGAYLISNRRLLGVLRTDSRRLAVAGAALHWAYHCYASVTFALVAARAGFGAKMGRRVRARLARA